MQLPTNNNPLPTDSSFLSSTSKPPINTNLPQANKSFPAPAPVNKSLNQKPAPIQNTTKQTLPPAQPSKPSILPKAPTITKNYGSVLTDEQMTQLVNQGIAKDTTKATPKGLTDDELNALESMGKQPEQPQPMKLETNITGDYAKNLGDAYKSAVSSPETAGAAGDLGSILNEGQRQDKSTSQNPIIRTGENALAMTAQTLNTIFAPFGAAAKSLTDKISQQIENNPAIINSPIMGHIADFVNKASGAITDLTQKHPEAARNLSNSIGVIITALSGEEGGKLGLFKGEGVDTSLNPALEATKNAIINKTAGLPDAIQGAKESVGNAIAPKTSEEIALKNATPEIKQLTPTMREDMLRNGQINPQTALKGGTIEITPAEKALITKNADLFQGKTAVDNYYNVDNRIAEDNASIQQYLKDNGATFNKEQLKTDMLNATKDITDQTNSKAFEKAKGRVIDSVLESVGKVDYKGNPVPSESSADLLNTRQTFDRTNSAKLNSLFAGNDTGKNMFVKSVRDVMNKTISDSITDDTYAATMKDESGLISVRDNYLLPKAKATMTSSQLSNWIKNTPGVSQAIKLGKLTGLVELLGAK